jgi:hypothetical protein
MSRSRRIVIDCSIAQAAGTENAVHPTAKHCRDFLLAVLHICHRMVYSSAIKDEWDRHQSSFARKWRTEMFARKKIDRVVSPEDDELQEKLDGLTANDTENEAATKDPACLDNIREAMKKDLHLVEAALATDRIVASLDDAVRDHFKDCSPALGRVKTVIWVNPNQPAEAVLSWLQNGAPLDKNRRLVRDKRTE